MFLFVYSGVKLKEAGQSAGTFVGEVAKDAKGNVSDVAEKVGSIVKSRWSFLQQPSTRHAMQERLISVAATTGMLFRKGVSETKEKVNVGKIKVEEVIKHNLFIICINKHFITVLGFVSGYTQVHLRGFGLNIGI